jgi:hypothetical protein
MAARSQCPKTVVRQDQSGSTPGQRPLFALQFEHRAGDSAQSDSTSKCESRGIHENVNRLLQYQLLYELQYCTDSSNNASGEPPLGKRSAAPTHIGPGAKTAPFKALAEEPQMIWALLRSGEAVPCQRTMSAQAATEWSLR